MHQFSDLDLMKFEQLLLRSTLEPNCDKESGFITHNMFSERFKELRGLFSLNFHLAHDN